MSNLTEQKLLKILSRIKVLTSLEVRGEKYDDLVKQVYVEVAEEAEGITPYKLPPMNSRPDVVLGHLLLWRDKVEESLRNGKFKFQVLEGGRQKMIYEEE